MKLHKITSLMMTMTNQCNLLCKYCFCHHDVQRMDYSTAKRCADFVIANACEEGTTPKLAFFGGEPLLEWDTIVVPLTNYIRQEYKKPFDLSLTTNGLLLTEDKLKFMVENRIIMMLSIDGDRKSQDYNRPKKDGSGSFDLIAPKIPLILSYMPHCEFRITLTAKTIPDFYENIRFVASTGCQRLKIYPNVFETWTDADVEYFKQQVSLLGDAAIHAFRHGHTPLLFKQYTDNFGNAIILHDAIERNQNRNCIGCGGCDHCGLGALRNASTDVNGNVFGCHHILMDMDSPFYLGSIWDGIDDVRREKLIGLFDEKPLKGKNCAACDLNLICSGGCAPNNYAMFGDLSLVPPIYCDWTTILFNDAVRVCQILGEEKNILFKTFFDQAIGRSAV